MSTRRVFSIPSRLPFVDTLARGILDQAGDDPAALARYRILLPTRRSCRSLREAFLRLSGGQPTLLPRMSPIGDVDEDELMLGMDDLPGSPGGEALALAPAVPAMRRQLVLMRLIAARDPDQSPDQAALLARELARLMDQVATERLDFQNLEKLDVGNFADHWQETLEFLKLVTESWPAILAAERAIDPADRRNRLMAAQTAQWRDNPPDTPVIAAGSTGSIPATADLLGVIATLPQGAVVLPGMDTGLEEDAWGAVGPAHPQFGLKHLLAHLGIDRSEVQEWETASTLDEAAPEARSDLLRNALLPAPATGTPVASGIVTPEALDAVTRIDCPDNGMEARVIAISVREALENPGRTVAVITPDRALARRVAAELKRWELDVDDSAGIPLDQTPPGAFLRLTARMVVEDLSPVALLAALKHPLTACGLSPAQCRALVRQLEIEALRGVRPDAGIDGLKLALGNAPKTAPLRAFLERLEPMLAPMTETMDSDRHAFAALLKRHIAMAESLAESDAIPGVERLWRGEAGEALSIFIAELHEALDEGIVLATTYYPALLDTLMLGHVVRPRHNRHPRLHIWGPMEARLQHADTLILGGLNEGTWPPEPDASPWMSRPMMTAFGLPVPERRIGLSAHDFAQAFAAPRVILTRAERVDGTPTVASRWLRRIENLVTASAHRTLFDSERATLELAMALNQPNESETVTPAPPAPRPPLAARPRTLSVTRVRDLQRDPYAVYAREILKLRPLDPIDADPGAADRGTIIHDVLETFVRAYPDDLPDDAETRLINMGRETFGEHLARPGIRAFWWPRFLRIAEWFVADERARRDAGERPVLIEQTSETVFNAPGGEFRLRAKADRMDQLPGGGLGIVDYKTGVPASAPQVETGLEPQLPLEAAMVREGAFDGLPEREVRRLSYIRVSGGREPGKVSHLKLDADEVITETWEGFQNLIAGFDDPNTPYLSRTRPMKQREEGDYDHLARVREWLNAEDES